MYQFWSARDSLEVLRGMQSDFVDSIVTDPPYGISFMNRKWDYDVPSVALWKECLRVLKPGGHMLVACGTRTQHRMVVNIEDAGFEIRDVITWLYGSGFPKSMNIEKSIEKETHEEGQWEGWGTALKPACEFWTLCRKPLKEKTIAKNVLEHGTGGLNIDGCRVSHTEIIAKPPLSTNKHEGYRRPWNDDEKTRQEMSLRKKESQDKAQQIGRFPANLILDEESAEMLDQQSGFLHKAGNKKDKPASANHIYGKGITGTKNPAVPGDRGGGASRFFYTVKASRSDRGEGNNHPTVKPTKLMAYLCKLITPPNGIVLDPFSGSGSTGVAALREGFQFYGIEIDEKYSEIAVSRLEKAKQDLGDKE